MADLNLAVSYLNRLKRKFGPNNIRAVISEYPSIPLSFYCPNYGYIAPGFTGYPPDPTPVRAEAVSKGFTAESTTTTYTYDLVLSELDPNTGGYVERIRLEINETRGAFDYLLIIPRYVDPQYANCDVYIAGQYLGKANMSAGISLPPGAAYPSMRTAVRHVDMLGGLMKYWGYPDYQDVYVWAKELIAATTYGYYTQVFDIYAPAGKDLGSPGETVIPVSEHHFWDALYWNGVLGYSTLISMFDAYGLIKARYPMYPYKSKLVGATMALYPISNGAQAFLSALSQCGDPLLDAWWGLYYAAIEDWANALSKWNAIVSKWDGNGVVPSGWMPYCKGAGYSTVRLAAALALGSILAKRGIIQWDIPDRMYNVLDQLQWARDSGYYSPDGSTVYTIYKPDHKGGFMVSYGPIGSYGYVPFRPSLIEELLPYLGSPPEYGGVIPTNAETTIVSLIALATYRKAKGLL